VAVVEAAGTLQDLMAMVGSGGTSRRRRRRLQVSNVPKKIGKVRNSEKEKKNLASCHLPIIPVPLQLHESPK
jgi:hypothetical protein